MYKSIITLSTCLLMLTSCVSTSDVETSLDNNQLDTSIPSTPQSAVDRHNAIRAEVFAGASMSWSETLAATAQEYANYLASTGEFKHDEKSDYGENLYASSQDATYVEAIDSWYAERVYYNYADNSCSGTCGHYTQMIWRDSQQLGCAKATYTKGQYQGWSVVVCRYDPAGNYIGERPY